jgi:flagellin
MSSINLKQQPLDLAASLARIQNLADSANNRVSSGRRLDTPSSDVAGAGRAAKLDGQQSRLRAVEVNLQDGQSRLQSTAGQVNIISRVVTRLGELSTLGANSVQDPASRSLYNEEFTQLQNQLRTTIGGTTAEIGGPSDVEATGTFNGFRLFGSGPAESISIGPAADERLTLPRLDFASGPLGGLIRQDASGNFLTKIDDPDASSSIRAALAQTTDSFAQVGAAQSRLGFAAGMIATADTNNEAALSVIRDADVAADITKLSRFQILTESHHAMLAQSRDSNAKLIALLSRG